jgi:hypothetical protein
MTEEGLTWDSMRIIKTMSLVWDVKGQHIHETSRDKPFIHSIIYNLLTYYYIEECKHIYIHIITHEMEREKGIQIPFTQFNNI